MSNRPKRGDQRQVKSEDWLTRLAKLTRTAQAVPEASAVSSKDRTLAGKKRIKNRRNR